MVKQETFVIQTPGRGTLNITRQIREIVNHSGIHSGLCNVFIEHTSASLILCENADPTVRRDLESFMARTVRDGDPTFLHTDEGADDMPAHIRTILTHNDINIPVSQGQLKLGTWQGVFVWEHRTAPHHRTITVTVMGE